MDKGKQQIARAYFEQHIDRIGDWCVGDIRRCCRLRNDGQYEHGGALIGAFILWVCSLDYLGGLLTNSHHDYSKRIETYLDKYFNQSKNPNEHIYDLKQIIEFRNGIIHSYSPNYALLSKASKEMHLTEVNGRTFLVLEEIVADSERAFKNFKKDLLSNDQMLITAFNYYKKYPPVGPLEL